MKRKLLFLALGALSVLSVSCASPRQFAPPSVAATRAGVTKSQQNVASAQTHLIAAQKKASSAQATGKKLAEEVAKPELDAPILRLLVTQQNEQIDGLTAELLETQNALVDATSSLASSQAAVNTYEIQVKAQTATLNDTAAKLDKTSKAYHKLKFWVCLLAAAAAFLLLWKFKTILAFMGPYGLYALIGGPVAVFGFLWLLL